MPPRLNPLSDLARMYQERIPTAPKSIGRQGPVSVSGGTPSWLRATGNFLKTAVESLDPRVIAREGGRSVEHVYGDTKELAKSIVTGEDTLSQSPTARTYQAAGGGAQGALAAALPYINVGTAVMPTTKVLTPAGRAALGADAAERLAQRQIMATAPEPTIGIHVSPRSGLETIRPQEMGQAQVTAGAIAQPPPPQLISIPKPTIDPVANLAKIQFARDQVPPVPPSFPNLPQLPSTLSIDEFRASPEFALYRDAGQNLASPIALEEFSFDPGKVYLAHSGAGKLTGGVLDPDFTTRTSVQLNATAIRNAQNTVGKADATIKALRQGLDDLQKTGTWSGEALNDLTIGATGNLRGLLPPELAQTINLSNASADQLQAFVDRVQLVINSSQNRINDLGYLVEAANNSNFLSYYPGSTGPVTGYLTAGGWGGANQASFPAMHIVAADPQLTTSRLGPGRFIQGLPAEFQAFGAQAPIASLGFAKNVIPNFEDQWAGRAFAVQKIIEDRIRRGLYPR